MRNQVSKLLLCLVPIAGACASSTSADLPRGWETAERLEHLMQMECSHSDFGDEPETLSQGSLTNELEVTYEHAHFRCVQPVEGYLRESANALEVLVQPIDMNPDAIAGCDCRYTIKMQVPVESDTHQVTVFRRWDNHNEPNLPVKIGALEL